ncbi:MAG TPA: amino acid permease [Ktedonobacteraceae bacterium]|nr:amino acid permease [Ktedonobacteraceae bacterium]
MQRFSMQEKRLSPISPQLEPLRSEQRINEFFPRVLSRVDLLAVFVAIVVFAPDASLALSGHRLGFTINLYWVIGVVTFLIPGAVVSGQLNRWMPSDGSVYVWTHRALGPLWGFLAGFCAWLPGTLIMVAYSNNILAHIQRFSVQPDARAVSWLIAPWQQGTLIAIVLLLTGWLATFSLPVVMKIAKVGVVFYLLTLLGVGLAGGFWLWSGHAPQTSFTGSAPGLNQQSLFVYGVIVLALLGIEVPLKMSAETVGPHAPKLFLRWGPLVALVAYVSFTFGLMVTLPSAFASLPQTGMLALNAAFGTPVAVIGGIIIIAFNLISIVVYNVAFARILFVSALDQRLPSVLAGINRFSAPVPAIVTQVAIALAMVLLTYFIGPSLSPETGTMFTTQVYDVVLAMVTVVWCLSMIFLFVDLLILLWRARASTDRGAMPLIAPAWLLYLCCIVGVLTSLLGMWTTLGFSWNSQLIPTPIWRLTVGLLTLAVLAIGLVGSAYPLLLGALEAQTATAQENARLFNEEVRRSKEQLETIFQNIADGILVQNASKSVVFANKVAASLLGFPSVEELLRTSVQSPDWMGHLFAFKDEQGEPVPLGELAGNVARRERKNVAQILQYRHIASNRSGWISTKAQPILDEQGDVELVVSVLTDITQSRELEQRKNVFISMASHELKTPVTSLKGFSYALQRRLTKLGDEPGLRYLSKMNAQLDRLTKLVSDLLDISRMQTSQLIYRMEPCDLDALIRETVVIFQEITPSHRIILEGSIHGQVMGDRDRLGQVLLNLLNNAQKYSPHADRIIVHLSQDRGNAMISVKDFGIGIDEAHQQRIFERFYQIADLEERTYPGLGIGLYLSGEIIQRHHGSIRVESKKDEGSIFSVSLPLYRSEQ